MMLKPIKSSIEIMIKQKSFFCSRFLSRKVTEMRSKGLQNEVQIEFPNRSRTVFDTKRHPKHHLVVPGAPKWSSGDPFWSSFLIKNGDDVNLDIRYHFGCFRNYTNSTTHKINYFIQESTGCIILGK